LDGFDVLATDIDEYDVRVNAPGRSYVEYDPTIVFHLAAAKHAPDGEVNPLAVAETNVIGTANVLDDFPRAKVVLTSTCKAADPETAYGASKLIAERMVLNAGGTVARLYNVTEASGNVLEYWASLPPDEPLPVTPCLRYFISMEQAVDLVLRCAVLPTGRYSIDPGWQRAMESVAREHYPGRALRFIYPRRGDRLQEPLIARSERFAWAQDDGLRKIESPHDPVVVREHAAAAA
jgi:FlaA1/EpsC-like NDP-sugar epimerase